MVVEQVRDLGVDLILGKMMDKITTDDQNNVTGLQFKDGEVVEGTCVCVAVGITKIYHKTNPNSPCRLVLRPVMIWQERLVLLADPVVALLLGTICKPPLRIFMRSANARTGLECATVSMDLVLRWLIFLLSI